MSQYGAAAAAAKNPPWVRTTAQSMATSVAQQQQLQNQILTPTAMGTLANPAMVQYQQQQQVFQNPMQLQQAGMAMTNMTAATIGTTGVAVPTGLGASQIFPQVATVSYPAPRALNPTAFQSAAVAATVPPVTATNPSPKQRVFTGTVTKVHDNFGFVDEDVFFQTSCCVKGSNPVVGDRVLVEASYNPNMPFKWNATRIQVLPMSGSPAQRSQSTTGKGFSSSGSGTYNAVPPPAENSGSGSFGSRNNQRKLSGTGSRRERSKDKSRDDDEEERKKRREERARDREEKEKRSPSVRRRSKSPRPQPRRRTRIVPRYMVQIPKIALDLPEADVLELRRRYTNMYIPSDFFSTNFRWVDAFPPNNPFTLDRPCSFHIMNKEVDSVLENKAVWEPPDADYLFSAKVMLMSMPAMEEIYRKCCGLAEDKEKDDERDPVHPTRLVNFLVGLRGKNETMAIGGPWSPSLDGDDPDKDPSVLIKTAIRTCLALTGINLSPCTRWYRFLEIYYRRGETTHKGRVVPARVETVVLFLPDVWSCVPTRLEWDGLHLNYKRQLERKLKADQDVANGGAAAGDEKDEEESTGTQEPKREPTHYSELDPKTMKVSDLRQELEARTLSPKGLKSQLIARLTKAIKTEAEKAEELEERKVAEPEPPSKSEAENKDDEKKKKEEEEKKKQDERDKVTREKRYTLPDSPHILVHPSRTAKSGKFDCTIMSLSLLLDYRPEDTKEHSFEVSLFAELFNEMLMRDYGFNIYRALYNAPERPKEDEKDKDRKKDRDKKDEKDKKDDKKNGDRDDRDKRKDDRHSSRDKKDDRGRHEEKEKSHDKDDDDDEDDDDEEDEDSKDSKKDSRDRDDRRRNSKDKEKKKKKVKLYTADPNLLLSFIYFDQSHCGYIFDKDIEELLYTLGLNLSRAQVRKLVQKVVTRDSLHYRKLTDKEVKSDDSKDADKDKAKEKELDNEADSVTETVEKLAYGNKRLLPVFSTGLPPSKRARKETPEDKETSAVVPEGFLMHKGALVDVDKLMQQLQRSEKARLDTENKMMILKQDLSEVKETARHSANTVKDLSSDLRDYKQRLLETDRELSKTRNNLDIYYSTLKDIQRKISPVLSHESSSHSSSDWRSSAKSESSQHSRKTSSPSVTEIIVEEKEKKGSKSDSNTKKENKEKPVTDEPVVVKEEVKEPEKEKVEETKPEVVEVKKEEEEEEEEEEEKKDDSNDKTETVEMEVD